ncbi:MAG: PQQ-binding-like beta-propeller repeat protein, partial [Candidatus Hydrogenedentota bacterium]
VVQVVASIGGSTKEAIPGHIRGYDARTGERLWIFHTVPQAGEFGVETWEDESWKYTGNAGVWTLLSADEELGYVYLPLETATNDWFGGHRIGDNLFAESLVCLDAKTGKRVWHYQIVHHGLWDYDLPAAPVLCDITVDGRKIKAVAQVTKQGFCFVFDRVTGEPVWPIVEMPVPQSKVPGELSSPTQPVPSKPVPFERQGFTVDNLIDFTPELSKQALAIASKYRLGSLYSPPSVLGADGFQGTLALPGYGGGANWPGAALDAEEGILYIPSATVPIVMAVDRPQDTSRSNLNYVRIGPIYPEGPDGLPLVKPPWGRITAIDLNTGEHLWMVPNGGAPKAVRDHPDLQGLDFSKMGQNGRPGALVTKTLLFVGEGGGLRGGAKGAGGPMLRAYDKKTGDVIAEHKLPGGTTGVPMTYMLNGKQYICVAIGAEDLPAELIALSLP